MGIPPAELIFRFSASKKKVKKIKNKNKKIKIIFHFFCIIQSICDWELLIVRLFNHNNDVSFLNRKNVVKIYYIVF